MTPEEAEALLIKSGAVRSDLWTQHRIQALALLIAEAVQKINDEADEKVTDKAESDYDQALIRAQEAINLLRSLMPKIKRNIFPLEIRRERPGYISKCEKLEDALFDIPVHKPERRNAVHECINALADAYGSLTGDWRISRKGPAAAFINGALAAVGKSRPTGDAIQKAVKRDRATCPSSEFHRAWAAGLLDRVYAIYIAEELAQDLPAAASA